MTGPEHFAAAERFAESASEAADRGDELVRLGYAQVHATLALAAATALARERLEDLHEWGQVAGVATARKAAES